MDPSPATTPSASAQGLSTGVPAVGRISLHPRGFGFLAFERPDGTPASAWVSPPDCNALLEGDRVRATVAQAHDGRWSAMAPVLLERTRRALLGEVVKRGTRWFLRPDKVVSNTDWPLKVADGKGAIALVEGTFVVADIVAGPAPSLLATRVMRGVEDREEIELERVILRHGLRGDFDSTLKNEAIRIAKTPRIGHRRDLREVPTVTIDAPATRDLDDALSAFPADEHGAVRVLVSIADVDAYVAEDSPIDLEARARGTSVYLAGRVLPMLPESLCDAAISLMEGCERPALTVELRVGPEGEITSVDVYASLIRSHARLTYEAVSALISTGKSPDVPDSVVTTLRWLRTAASRLSAVRAARGGLELAREESYVTLDASTGAPVDVTPRADTEAHRLVERLMVAANESVARWLVERGLPGIFRTHDEPTVDRVEALARFSRNFGVEPGLAGRLTPRGLSAFEAMLRGVEAAPAIRTVLARVLGPARYTRAPGLHFGLAAPLYLHFTSPIRRYPDLVVHRIVKRFLAGERDFKAISETLEPLARKLDDCALVASKAEVERHRMLVARLFSSRIGERRAGNIVSVKPFGLVVQMVGTGATGTIALEALEMSAASPGGQAGPYDVDLAMQTLSPRAGGLGRSYSVGDAIEVEVVSTDPPLGRIDLRVVPPVAPVAPVAPIAPARTDEPRARREPR